MARTGRADIMKRILIGGVVLAGLWFAFGRTKPPKVVDAPPAAVVSVSSEREAPRQDAVTQPHAFVMNGYELITLAQFGLTARALSVTGYRTGRESDLSPMDVAFGWGRMSESPVSRTWNVSSQSARRLPPARTTGRRKLVIDRAQPGWKTRGSDEARNATRSPISRGLAPAIHPASAIR